MTELLRILTELEKPLAELSKLGINLSRKEKQEITEALREDVQRDVPKAERQTFMTTLLEIGETVLPLLGPLISLI